MAPDGPFESVPPPDEAWWARELHRNEKLMDKFMAALGDDPDWTKLEKAMEAEWGPSDEAAEGNEGQLLFESDSVESNTPGTAEDDLLEPDPDEDPEVNANYPDIARLARDFACNVFNLENLPGDPELLFLSAGKVGANLAGGHGLGYDDEFICGNIVKCRWALSDSEFCREMLEQLHQQTGEAVYARLAEDSRRISEAIRERIARLRQRVWW